MYELPLFPLNTVLFPGTPIHLHIFEERYKEMINRCLFERKPFGVVLIRSGHEALGPLPEAEEIGCAARIFHVQKLEQGRMNIVALGHERFRILSVDRASYSYLIGQVEDIPLAHSDVEVISQLGDRLRPRIQRFLQMVLEAGKGQVDASKLPDDPVHLAYMGASLLNIPPAAKHVLLCLQEPEELLQQVNQIYRRELALLRAMLAIMQDKDSGTFSIN